MSNREVMQQALEGIQSTMEMAFHERYAECCGQGQGGECCGSPVEAWPEWAQKVMGGLADSQRALSAELAKPDDQGIRDLEEAEQYIQQSIDNAPEPLKRLGEWLTNVLDENQWPHAERLLLGAIAAKPTAVPDGWVMVPKEPTWEMNAAGSNAGGLGYRDVENINDDVAEDVYKAMLAAAPQPPAPAVDAEAARLYNELLYHVEKKHPNETRHETALRYIKQAERPTDSNQLARAIGENLDEH